MGLQSEAAWKEQNSFLLRVNDYALTLHKIILLFTAMYFPFPYCSKNTIAVTILLH